MAAGVSVTALGREGARPTAAELPVSVVEGTAVVTHNGPVVPRPESETTSGFRRGERGLTASERAGREIWYKATAGNGRFHSYVFQQRLGVRIDWHRVLRSDERQDRFKAWGLINDPDCCTPGTSKCPAKSLEDTYGFDWCPGDETLARFVGRSGYRDPACDFEDAPAPTDGGVRRDRQDPCDLAFGTSTGALGLRKFPNPRFDAGSVEPPYYVGMACGACHIGFDPLNPPSDPTNPGWENIAGAIGNQYARFSEIMVSGMPTDSPEWQIFTHTRPGTVDTSAVPNDQVHNPGTMPAIINLAQRPTFRGEPVLKWRRTASCAAGRSDDDCWCEPGKPGKCWTKSVRDDDPLVRHILKGGEDSIGTLEAVQRVYVNIGSCAETCWVNHLTDLRQLDPSQRGYGQTAFDIGQCRRDCPSFRAVEDRLEDIGAFLQSKEARATDLHRAKGIPYEVLRAELEKEFGRDAVARGRTLFAVNCARCHSSQAEPFQGVDFRETTADPTLRLDWLGSDKAVPASRVGTFPCRALHANHMQGRVWEEYSSLTYRSRAPDPKLKDRSGGGRGYYRPVSLLSVWAHAPFMHNNAIGPELCGEPANEENDFYRSPWVDESGAPLASSETPPCVPYDPSVEGRFRVFKASMQALLHPDERGRKVSLLDQPIRLELGLLGLRIEFPRGIPAGYFGNFQHKAFFGDLVRARTRKDELESSLVQRFGAGRGEQMARELGQVADAVRERPDQLLGIVRPHLQTIDSLYLSCSADTENDGHRFGESLSEEDKKALVAFLATL